MSHQAPTTKRTSFAIDVAHPYAALLELEARESDRDVSQHLGHILARRYDSLRRICTCGFFIYDDHADLRCAKCGAPCCPNCSTAVDERDVCEACPVP